MKFFIVVAFVFIAAGCNGQLPVYREAKSYTIDYPKTTNWLIPKGDSCSIVLKSTSRAIVFIDSTRFLIRSSDCKKWIPINTRKPFP